MPDGTVSSRNHLLTVRGKMIFQETGPPCQKVWGVLLYAVSKEIIARYLCQSP